MSDLLSKSVSLLISPISTSLILLSYSPILLTFFSSFGYLFLSRYSNSVALERVVPLFLIIVNIKNDHQGLMVTLKPNPSNKTATKL